ncbi:MAG: hypothetical protein ACRC6T_09305 [Sarcina sp.]
MYSIRRDGERLEQDYQDKVKDSARSKTPLNKTKDPKKKLENYLKNNNRNYDF